MKITLKYQPDDETSVKKAFDVLLVWHSGDADMVMADMKDNSIAASNRGAWEMENKVRVQTAKVWAADQYYAVGETVIDADIAYQVIQAHTSQVGWNPVNVPALFRHKPITMTGENYPRWEQPLGAHDVYKLNNKVTHNGADWISTNDNNVWEPGVSQWDEL